MKLHLHLAAHCAMTKKLLGESIDHVGIVYMDQKTKLPMILEAVPWQGVFATPFQERITRGDESRISIVPLKLPGGNDTAAKYREKRVVDRINTFAMSAQGTDKVPTAAKVCLFVAFVISLCLLTKSTTHVASFFFRSDSLTLTIVNTHIYTPHLPRILLVWC
jgi:hypothetical protein